MNDRSALECVVLAVRICLCAGRYGLGEAECMCTQVPVWDASPCLECLVANSSKGAVLFVLNAAGNFEKLLQ